MIRAACIALAYAVALFCIWHAISIAPDMQWPRTDRELIAACLLTIGMIFKTGAHVAAFVSLNAGR